MFHSAKIDAKLSLSPHTSHTTTMPKDAAPEVMPELGIDTLFNLRGRVALVTGGATGIGKMVRTRLATVC
jgi:hypothetical protein